MDLYELSKGYGLGSYYDKKRDQIVIATVHLKLDEQLLTDALSLVQDNKECALAYDTVNCRECLIIFKIPETIVLGLGLSR